MITFSEDFKIYVLPWISLLVTGYIAWSFYHYVLCALHDKWTTRSLIRKKQREREHAFQKLEQRYSMSSKAEKIISLTEDQLLNELQQRKLTATEVLEAFIAKVSNHNLCIMWSGGAREVYNFHNNSFKAFILKNDSWGCGNPIFGETKNSLNSSLSPGGSSGGEASLIASGASFFGVGSDAAGSVRIPAHCCGITSLKPTKMRLSPAGFQSSAASVIGLYGVGGLMGKSVGFIKKVFQLLTTNDFQSKYDRLTIPIPWNDSLFSSKRPMRIGYYTNIGYFPVIGDTETVVLNAKEALEAAGHTLIPVQLPDAYQVVKVFADLVYADGGEFICKAWKDEPVAQAAIFHFLLSWIPRRIRLVLATVMNSGLIPFFYSPRIATIFRGGAEKSSRLMMAMNERSKLLEQIVKEWQRHDLDLLLCPTFPFPAVPIKYAAYLKLAAIHTLMWNVFNWPAGVVKFGVESGKRINEYNTEGDFFLQWALDAAKQSTGMPITVQIVGLPFQEETVLRGMVELERIYNCRRDKGNETDTL